MPYLRETVHTKEPRVSRGMRNLTPGELQRRTGRRFGPRPHFWKWADNSGPVQINVTPSSQYNELTVELNVFKIPREWMQVMMLMTLPPSYPPKASAPRANLPVSWPFLAAPASSYLQG